MSITIDVQKQVPRNFVEHLRVLAVTRAEEIAMVVVTERDGMPVDTVITYGQLDTRVRALAAVLQQRFDTGDRALLLLDNNDHYAVAFFACLYAGLIAVPVYPPESSREQHLARLLGIAHDAQARCILTSSDVLAVTGVVLRERDSADLITVDTVDETAAANWREHSPAADHVAFLQYTSGSTSAPKGVMVSHDNLMVNERAIEDALSITADDVLVSWLPLFHDMGLIGGLLQPIYRGIKLVLMSPAFFLQRPARWLEAISRHGGTISGGPDFAYRLCFERIKDSQLAQLDLSSWRVAFSGAEPVRHDTLQEFTARFAAAAFDPRAVCPCYGLAEATLMVSSGRRGSGMKTAVLQSAGLQRGDIVPDDNGQIAVACGAVVGGHTVSIRDCQSGRVCAGARVGEIWVSGPSIAMGYWYKPEATAESFVERDGQRWLRTGDLGFVYDDQLYIAGRVKDLIIVRGHNLYPQDIERAIENEVDAVRKGRAAAFAVDGSDGEGIGIAVEVSRSLQKRVPADTLVTALNVAVSEACGEPLAVAVLLNPGALPKTSSGKLQRRACRQGAQEKTLDAYAIYEHGGFVLGGPVLAARHDNLSIDSELDELESKLAEIWAAALRNTKTKTFDRNSHFFAAGGNSLAATQVAAAIEFHWGVAFSVRGLFEHPRLSECAAELRRCLADGSLIPVEPIPVRPTAQRNRRLPLSPAQQRQWFLWKLDPTGSAYHIQGALRLTGPLNRGALTAAVTCLAQRHESLRTVFSERIDGEAEQCVECVECVKCVETAGRLTLRFTDLRDSPDAESRVAAILQELNGEPFDLTSGPLARMMLMRLSETEHILAVVIHHIIADGVSMQLMVDELGARYAAVVHGEQPNLPQLSVQYADYTLWQRQWLDSDAPERQLRYWRDQLGGESEPLRLPTDFPRPTVARYQAGQHDFQMPWTLSIKLRALAENTGTTLVTVLLAGFQVLLYRYAGQPDIRVGVPSANRSRAEIQNVVGFFVNTLVLRNVLDGRMPLSQVLQQAMDATLDAQAHQDLPFEQIVEGLQPERSLSHNPLFQVMFNHLREDFSVLQGLSGLLISRESFVATAAQFELNLDTREDADGRLRAALTYARELFASDTIERLAGHYLRILSTFADQSECPVGDIKLLSEPESEQLRAWSVNHKCYPNTAPVHRLIEQQVHRNPAATALIFGDEQLSYTELNQRANRLAHRLIKLGVKPEVKVGIAAERAIGMVVGLLAILKAGGAYVPLDPEYPPERLAYMIDDSGIELLLMPSQLKDRLPAREALRVLMLDKLDLRDEPESDPQVAVHGQNLVYVIYTSGSTGKPKGAANRHHALHNRLMWMQEAYPLDASDTVLQKTPFSFDVSVWEFFWPLMVGARLVVAGPGDHRDPARLVELITGYDVTTLHFVPSMLQAFIGYKDINKCTALKHLICSGEALSPEAQHAVFMCLPDVALHNLYGPTEAAIDVTHWTCGVEDESRVPIGRPISGIQTWVLDEGLNQVPLGVAGELYLGGVGLARGYLNRAGMTTERFVADPHSADGKRLYRTGDLARWNAEGQLQYLGRIDHQVKVRGFRIELGEIEAQLLAQKAVRDAVVVARDSADGTRLVAYVTAAAEHAIDVPRLREQLAVSLPDYMLPNVIAVLEHLPLSANGKVDRKALPEPELTSSAVYEPPQGEIEEVVEQIWTDVLAVARVGRHDNFFDLGGHSLQLIRVHRLLEDRFHAGLSVIDLFKHPTVDSLAKRIGQTPDQPPAVSSVDVTALALRRREALLQRKRLIERISR